MRDDKETMIRFLLYVQGTGLKIFSASVGFVYFFFYLFPETGSILVFGESSLQSVLSSICL